MDSKKNSELDLKTIIEGINHYVDKHLMEMRLSIGVLGIVGVGVVFRSIRFATKFYSNNKIPKSFVDKNIRLRGIVKSVSNDGTLNVDHIPILSMPWHRNTNNDRLLSVSLEAIRPTISGVFWLKLNIENKIIWFKIISRNENDINCIVSNDKKILFKKSLNAELVERGLAQIKPIDQHLRRVKAYQQLYRSLTTSQIKAKKSKAGIWWKPSALDVIRDRFERYLQILKNIRRNVF